MQVTEPLFKKSEPIEPWLIEILPSRLLTLVLLLGLTIALICIVVCHIFTLAKIFFFFVALFYTLYIFRRYIFLLNQQSIVCCQPLYRNFWRLKTLNGRWLLAEEGVYSYRSFYLIVLHFYILPQRKRVKVPIAFDATAKLNYIRLLSRLLLK